MGDSSRAQEAISKPIPLFVDQHVLPETIDYLIHQRGGFIHPQDCWQYEGKEWRSFESTDVNIPIKILHSVSLSESDDVKLRALQINRKIKQLQSILDCQEVSPITCIVDPTQVEYGIPNSKEHGYVYDRFNNGIWIHNDAFYSEKIDNALVEAMVYKACDKKTLSSSLLTNGFRTWSAWQIKDEDERKMAHEQNFDYRSKNLVSYFKLGSLSLETSIPEWLWSDFGGTLIDVIYQSLGKKQNQIGQLWKTRDPHLNPTQWIQSLGLDSKEVEQRWLDRLYGGERKQMEHVVAMVDSAKKQGVLGMECGRRFTQHGAGLTPPGQEFDTVALKKDIHHTFIELIIPFLVEGDRDDIQLLLNNPKEFFEKKGADRLTQIIFNPDNKLLRNQEGKSISFIDHMNDYFKPLGIVFETISKATTSDEEMDLVAKAMLAGRTAELIDGTFVTQKTRMVLRVKAPHKEVEIPIYSTKEKLHEGESESLTGAVYLPGRVGGKMESPLLLLSFWSNYAAGDTASLFSPLLDDFAKIAHEISHAATDVSQDNHFLKKKEISREYEKAHQRLQDIVFGRELPANHQEKGELMQRIKEIKDQVWQDNVISEGAAENARVALLQSQATGFQASGNTKMGKACEYLAQRHMWKYQYSNGDDKDLNVYPIGLVLGQIVGAKFGSRAFWDMFYQEQFDQYLSESERLFLIDLIKKEVGLVAREVITK